MWASRRGEVCCYRVAGVCATTPRKLLRRSALPSTKTLDSAIAPAAKI
eukprot:gene51358-62803_t